jgi:hypothetical protein
MIINIDPSIINELKKVPISEYGIFDHYNFNEIQNQMQFLADMLLMANPERVLEIGTNLLLPLFCKLHMSPNFN